MADTPADAKDNLVTLDLYNLTDVHGHIEQVTTEGTVTEAGLAAVGCYLNKARTDNPDSSFTLLGDNIGASTFTSGLLKDNPTIEALNKLKPLASTLGNHELDEGAQVFKDRIDGKNGYTKIEFPYLAINVDGMGNHLGDYTIWKSPSGVNVAFIGAIADDVQAKVSPGLLSDLTFNPPLDLIHNTAKELKESGKADVVIAMLDDDTKNNYPLMNQYIDGLMGGDTHVPYQFTSVKGADGNTLSAVASGSYTDNLADLKLTYDKNTKKVVKSEAVLIPANKVSECGEDPTIKAIVDKAVKNSQAEGDKVISSGFKSSFNRGVFSESEGQDPVPGSNRGVESSLGDLAADMMRDEIFVSEGKTVDIGIINAGGLRADLTPDKNGNLTYRQAFDVMPFSNELGYVSITGAEVKNMLEQQWKTKLTSQNSRPLLKLGISSNVSYTYDPARPFGDRITSVTINDKPLDPKRTYTVGSVTFLLAGGDSFPALTTGGKPRLTTGLDRDHFVNYLKKNSGVSPRAVKSSVGITLPSGPVKNGDTVSVALRGLSFTEGPSIPKTVSVALGGKPTTVAVNNSLVEPNNNNERSIITTDGAGQANVKVTVDAGNHCVAHSDETITIPVTVTTNLGELVSADAQLGVNIKCPAAPAKDITDAKDITTKKPKALPQTGSSDSSALVLVPVLLGLTVVAMSRSRKNK